MVKKIVGATVPLKHVVVGHSTIHKWDPKIHIFRQRVVDREWLYISNCGYVMYHPRMWQQRMQSTYYLDNFCERCARKEGLGRRSIRQVFEDAYAEQTREAAVLQSEHTSRLMERAKVEMDEIWCAMTQMGWLTEIVSEPYPYVETTTPSGRVYIVSAK